MLYLTWSDLFFLFVSVLVFQMYDFSTSHSVPLVIFVEHGIKLMFYSTLCQPVYQMLNDNLYA
jgi:hypothetical protein